MGERVAHGDVLTRRRLRLPDLPSEAEGKQTARVTIPERSALDLAAGPAPTRDPGAEARAEPRQAGILTPWRRGALARRRIFSVEAAAAAKSVSIWDRATLRFGLAVAFVGAAIATSFLAEEATGSFVNFPFYAAVVASAWFGTGPGLLSLALASLAVADFFTPERFSLNIEWNELPSFGLFLICALMSLAWSSQRRRAQYKLETTVADRTADLLHANTALQAEIAERVAAETERQKTEQALREAEAELARTLRLATVAELAATIAHEVNQPLAAIVANGSACLRSLARDPPMLDNAREAAQCIVDDGHRAGDVIARIRALFNKEEPKQQVLDVNHLIRRALALSQNAIKRERVVTRTVLASPSPLVLGDPVQLQQVMINLVTNALEAMVDVADRTRQLTVKTAIEDNRSVSISVEDSGNGLDPERISVLFESFYTTKPGGIGVGLAISRSIIEAPAARGRKDNVR
jgi:signal transduction histidine kinase